MDLFLFGSALALTTVSVVVLLMPNPSIMLFMWWAVAVLLVMLARLGVREFTCCLVGAALSLCSAFGAMLYVATCYQCRDGHCDEDIKYLGGGSGVVAGVFFMAIACKSDELTPASQSKSLGS